MSIKAEKMFVIRLLRKKFLLLDSHYLKSRDFVTKKTRLLHVMLHSLTSQHAVFMLIFITGNGTLLKVHKSFLKHKKG